MQKAMFQRTEIVLGQETMRVLQATRVILFGVGGVGSWCAESLVRTGIGHITLVDFDRVCETNINRQLPATTKTVGQKKVEVIAQRLLEINPQLSITLRPDLYTPDTAHSFQIQTYDVIIDAIDTVHNKLHLIREATKTEAFFISSMGAGRKIEPCMIRVAEFWDVNYCLFARRLRKLIRKGDLPHKPFLCVYSLEQTEESHELETVDGISKRINGTLAHITAIFGFTIAGEVVKYICNLKRR